MLTVCDLAEGKGLALGLDLDRHGRPHHPLLVIDLDSADGLPHDVIAAAAPEASRALPLTIGVAPTTPPPSLRPLLRALTFTLVPGNDSLAPGDDGRLVPGEDSLISDGGSLMPGDGHLVSSGGDLASGGGEPPWECVAVADLAGAVETVRAATAHAPHACLALNRLLRQSEHADVRSGLAAEAATYSMLLSGSEFRRWLAARGPARPAEPGEKRVRLSREGKRLAVVLDRPHRRNAMDARMREALVESLELALLDDSIEQVELSGTGPGFCAGGDLDEFGSAADYVTAYLVRLERNPGWLIHLLRDRFHARLHGACYGAGTEMPLFSKWVSAAPGTSFVLPEIAMGLIPGAGGTISLPWRAGRWRTAWMAVTGTRIDTPTALDWGLIDTIEPATT